MKNSSRPLFIAASIATAGFVGFMLGKLQTKAPIAPEPFQEFRNPPELDQPAASKASSIREAFSDGSSEKSMGVFFESLNSENVERFVEEIENLPPGPGRKRWMEALFEKWGAMDGPSAIEFAKNLKGRDHLNYLAATAKGWASYEPEVAWSEMMRASNNGSVSTLPLGPLIHEITNSDLGLAVSLVQDIDNAYYMKHHFDSVMKTVAENDRYGELLTSLGELEDRGKGAALAESLFETWGKYESERPLSALASLGDSDMAAKALSGMMRGWAQVEGREAFAYAVENRADPQIAELLASTAEQWALASTPDEIGFLFSDVTSIENSDAIIGTIALPLARIDPAMTMGAVSEIENDRSRSMTTAVVMGEWARTDIENAEDHYKAMPFDSSKQQAFWSLFNASMQQEPDPQHILGLVEELSDPEAINRSLVNIAEYTTILDSSQASLALANALLEALENREDLPEDTKTEIYEKLNPQS